MHAITPEPFDDLALPHLSARSTWKNFTARERSKVVRHWNRLDKFPGDYCHIPGRS